MAVSQLIVAIVGVAASSHAANQCLVAFSCIFIAGFAATWGPLCWAICGESFALNVRLKSISCVPQVTGFGISVLVMLPLYG